MTGRSLLGRSTSSSLVSLSQASCFVVPSVASTSALPSLPTIVVSAAFRSPPHAAALYSLTLPPARHRSSSQLSMSTASEKKTDTTVGTAASPISSNLESVRKRVAEVTSEGGDGKPRPRLVAVSKTKPIQDLLAAYEAGQRIFGENYAQELIEKSPQMPTDVVWHFIGHLQSKKAKGLVAGVPNLEVLETLDKPKLADKLQAACEAASREKPLGVFMQIDTSGEEAKSGIPHDDIDACLELARHVRENCPALAFRGVMTIGAPGDMSCFDKLVACRDALAAGIGIEPQELELSMGMSGDYEEAIRRGSTNVRVGSTIFGARHYPNKS